VGARGSADGGASFRPESRGARQPRSEDWRRRAKQVFLAGYRAAIGDCSSFSRNEASFSHLIAKFVLEKSLYQIYYETAQSLGVDPYSAGRGREDYPPWQVNSDN